MLTYMYWAIWAEVHMYPKIPVDLSIILYLEILLKGGIHFINFIIIRTKH